MGRHCVIARPCRSKPVKALPGAMTRVLGGGTKSLSKHGQRLAWEKPQARRSEVKRETRAACRIGAHGARRRDAERPWREALH